MSAMAIQILNEAGANISNDVIEVRTPNYRNMGNSSASEMPPPHFHQVPSSKRWDALGCKVEAPQPI